MGLLDNYQSSLKDAYAKGNKFLGTKLVKPTADNLFIGIKPTKTLAGIVVGSALAYTAAKTGWDAVNRSQKVALSNAVDVGNIAGLSYDAIGNVSGGKRDLGATGELVFGLHNARKG